MLLAILFGIPVLWVLYKYIICIINLRHYPPGPFPLPIIGNLNVMLKGKPTETLRDLAKIYGNVFSLSFGMSRIVVLNTVEPTRECLITKSTQFAGRPSVPAIKIGKAKGIVMADYGQYWKVIRKLCHSALKMFGDGLGKIEEKVIHESEELHKRVKADIKKPVDVEDELGLAVMNIICNMIFGHRYEIDDTEFKQFLEGNTLIIEGSKHGNPASFIPLLKNFPIFESQKKLLKGVALKDAVLLKKLKEHYDSFDPDNIRDLTDSLIRYSTDPEVLADSEGIQVTKEDLKMVISDMFIAGAETTYTTLKWCIIYLLHYPEYQDLMYEEFARVVGPDKYPDLKDRSSLPLFQGVIHEVLRMSSIAELGVIHKATQDGTIGGQNVPKDTGILFNMWYIHHDERYWDKPHVFNPYRWLDDDQKFTPGTHKSFLPFSAGRRSCVGESLAKTELFLFLSRLVIDFKFEANPDEPFPSLERQSGIVCTPKPYTVMFVLRKVQED